MFWLNERISFRKLCGIYKHIAYFVRVRMLMFNVISAVHSTGFSRSEDNLWKLIMSCSSKWTKFFSSIPHKIFRNWVRVGWSVKKVGFIEVRIYSNMTGFEDGKGLSERLLKAVFLYPPIRGQYVCAFLTSIGLKYHVTKPSQSRNLYSIGPFINARTMPTVTCAGRITSKMVEMRRKRLFRSRNMIIFVTFNTTHANLNGKKSTIIQNNQI